MQQVYAEVKTLDKRCYEKFALSEEILMENAGNALAKCVASHLSFSQKALFVCGSGNNGADGIVAARILHGAFDVAIYLPNGALSKMAKIQLKRAKLLNIPIFKKLENADVYVDALFGSGLSRPLDEVTCKIIDVLNEKQGVKIACDIPSGIMNDGTLSSSVFKADETVTMGALKLSLLGDNVKDFVGNISVANLGISRALYETSSDIYLLEEGDLKLPLRTLNTTHKGDFGHVATLLGEKEGACILASQSAFAFGAGLVTMVGAYCSQTFPPHIMRSSNLPDGLSVVVAGMGLGDALNDEMLYMYLLSHNKPLVLDADLMYRPIIASILKSNKQIVLTPHPKEFVALLKVLNIADIDIHTLQNQRVYWAQKFSQYFPHVGLILKGANSIIASQNKIYINPLGSSMLSKAGSGDVLSGMIGSLIAQGYSTIDACISASLAHAIVAQKLTCNNYALTPLDICEGIKWL
ncbi:MAG: NAD(P)H-hydrate dehydratase [Sulfurospirillaceae bacterium]|nr:NAD(P)H-hydrate dehydratase [Sulfurospirillaceae bacterium]